MMLVTVEQLHITSLRFQLKAALVLFAIVICTSMAFCHNIKQHAHMVSFESIVVPIK